MTHRSLSAVAGIVGAVGLGSLLAQSNAPTTDLPGVLPPGSSIELVALTPDGRRTYYVNQAGEIWLFDRGQKTGARITGGRPWDLAVSPTRDAIVYTRPGDKPTQQYVWVSPLDPNTGLARGPERRLSANRGDVPSISPDGTRVAFARDDTTGVGQSIVVVPLAGGAEQVVVPSLPSSIDYIRWAPDGTSLYFGVNPPVPCVPDWSCLPLPNNANRDKNIATIRRVPVTGGTASVVVASARSAFPGLSPDGTVIAYGDTPNTRHMTVTDASGKPLGGFIIATNQTVSGWLGGASLLVRSAGNVRRLLVTSTTGASPRVLFDSPDQLPAPAWSPDGKTMAAMQCTGTAPCELRLLNADGSLRHALTVPETFVTGIAWSPDQRWISYTGTPPNQTQRLVAIELSTDRVVPLGDMRQGLPDAVFWLAGSQRLMVTDQVGNGQNRRLSFRLVDVTGQSRPLRDLTVGEQPGTAVAIDASTALVARASTGDVRLASLSGDGPERVIVAGSETVSAPVLPVLSPDRQWFAVRRGSSAGAAGLSVVELCRVDGTARTTIDLPFTTSPGAAGLVILPGAKELIVVESWRQDVDPGVYLVTVATKAVARLFTYPSRPGRSGAPHIVVSADGRTVAYTVWEAPAPSFATMDLSAFRQPGVR